jgi:hypothetical protein
MIEQELFDSFCHEPDGSWTCIKPVLIEGPERRIGIMPGSTFSYRDPAIKGYHVPWHLDAAESHLHN